MRAMIPQQMWIEQHYRTRHLFRYAHTKKKLENIQGVDRVMMTKMESLYGRNREVMAIVGRFLGLDEAGIEFYRDAMESSEPLNVALDEIDYQCGRLIYELQSKNIPLGRFVSVINWLAHKCLREGSNLNSSSQVPKQLNRIYSELTGYDSLEDCF